MVIPGGTGQVGAVLNRAFAATGHEVVALTSAVAAGAAWLRGPVADGAQYVSWVHGHDFAAAVQFLIDRHDMSGPVNLAAPDPMPQRDFMRELRGACWLACHEMDGRTGCVRDPFRHREDEEPASRSAWIGLHDIPTRVNVGREIGLVDGEDVGLRDSGTAKPAMPGSESWQTFA